MFAINSIKNLVRRIARSRMMQPLWETLFEKSLLFMHYWGAGHWWTSGELNIPKRLLSSTENAVFFDVGANNGSYAQNLSTILPKSTRIFCFEPLPATFKKLTAAVAGVENVTLHNFGFGHKEETLSIYCVPEHDELASLHTNIPERRTTTTVEVKITTIDSYMKENDIQCINFLKIDVEGHELKVLEGAKNALDEGKIDYIQFEFGEGMIASRVFFRDFWDIFEKDFHIYRMLPNALRRIEKYSQNQEIFNCVNFLAANRKFGNLDA